MGKYFGTDGIRGIANKELSVEIALKVGQYLGYYFKGKNIIVGSDTRLSKDALVSALCAGITSGGANAYVVGVIPTPGVSYFACHFNFSCGVVISASHNPYQDNGIKVFNDRGEKLSNEIEVSIEKYIDEELKITLANEKAIGIVKDYRVEVSRYLDYLKETVDSQLTTNLKLVIDCANGAASYVAKELFDKVGIEVTVIFNNPDGVNINEKCGSTYLNNLSAYVKEHDYDLGIAFDGDADRMLAVSKSGTVISGDYLLYIYAKYLKMQNKLVKNTVVTTVMSNIGLYKKLDELGIEFTKTAVGDKYVYESMRENNYVLGGEQSGHIIFKEHATTGDGLLSALQLLNALHCLNQPLEELLAEVVIYPQVLKNVIVANRDIVLSSQELRNTIARIEKELGLEGRVLIRPSGTEPLIRVMIEASTLEICQKFSEEIVNLINQLAK